MWTQVCSHQIGHSWHTKDTIPPQVLLDDPMDLAGLDYSSLCEKGMGEFEEFTA